MAIQGLKTQMFRCFNDLEYTRQNNHFLHSCISEGLIPKGLKVTFNLAAHINNQHFVGVLQEIMNHSNSRLLDLIYKQNISKEEEIVSKIESLKEDIITYE